jgi:flagellar hook-associated protein 1 FlgK
MSLNVALLNALSGLQVNQRLLDLTSQNVSNVNTAGYSRKVAQAESVVLSGSGAGVRLGAVTRNVNESLLADLRQQASFLGQSDVLTAFYGRMQDLFGTPSSQSSIGTEIGAFADALQSLAAQPEDASRRITVVNRARFLADQFNSIALQVQELRKETDTDIANTVTMINDNLTEIADLNLRIAQGLATGQGATDLQDARDRAVNEIAAKLDIRYFLRDNGEMVIFTEQGRTLLDRTANQLSHTAAGSISASITWAGGSIDGITLGAADITSEIGSGELAALIEMRDTTLPNLASQFDELAAALAEEINAVHNRGTAFPGNASLTGQRRFAAADTPAWTGTARVVVTAADGTVVEVRDINLGATATVGALVASIDGMANATCALNANGQIVINATGGNTVAISEMNSAVSVGARTVGWSEFTGLNDFFTAGTDYTTYTSNQQTTDSAALGLAGTLTFSGSFGTTTVGYVVGNDLGDVAASINANAALTAAGISASVVADGDGYRLRIQDAGGQNFFVTDSGALISTLGIKARGAQTAADLGVRGDLLTDPGRVAHAELSSDPALAAGMVALGAGDNVIAQALANKFNEELSFAPIGKLAGTSRTLSEFGAAILALNATQAASAEGTQEWRQALFETLSNKAASISAVNLDEETANMVLLQNAYAASARVISTTAELFDVLMSIRS